MTHRHRREHRRPARLPVPGRRIRVIAALCGVLVSLSIPAAVLTTPAPTLAAQPAPRVPDDPARLGITGALPAGPAPGTATFTEPPDSPPSPSSDTPSAQAPPPDSPPADTQPGAGRATEARLVRAQSAPAPPADDQSAIPAPPQLTAGPLGMPGVMLEAYQRAARAVAISQPSCHLPWSVLAGIGRIESDHASQGRVDALGNTLGLILGPRLDGSAGMAAIPDTDHGLLDHDTVWDRAVGPMQFIPTSWRMWGNGNPSNIYDATLAAARYLCAGGRDLSDPIQLQAAVFGYNHSAAYVNLVLQWAHAYQTGVLPTPSAPGPIPAGTTGNGGRPIPTNPAPPAATGGATAAQSPLPTASPSPLPSPTTTPAPTPPATTSPPTPTTTAPAPSTPPTPAPPPATTPTPTQPPTTASPPTSAPPPRP